MVITFIAGHFPDFRLFRTKTGGRGQGGPGAGPGGGQGPGGGGTRDSNQSKIFYEIMYNYNLQLAASQFRASAFSPRPEVVSRVR